MIPMPQTAPPMKLPPPPRAIRRKNGSIGPMFLGFVVVATILGFSYWTLIPALIRDYVRSHGTPVTATVDGHHAERHSTRSGSYLTYTLHYNYEFDGKSLGGDQRVSPQTYSLADTGRQLPARAMRWGQWIFCVLLVEEPSSLRNQMITPVLGTAFVAIFLSMSVISIRRKRRLLEQGTVAAGTVVAHREVRGKSAAYYITLAFKATDGSNCQSETRIDGKSYVKAYVGSPVTVLYDPVKPTRCLAYEYCGYEVVPLVG